MQNQEFENGMDSMENMENQYAEGERQYGEDYRPVDPGDENSAQEGGVHA